ncbi:MAG: metal-binding protein [Acidimicrobiia bacterium]
MRHPFLVSVADLLRHPGLRREAHLAGPITGLVVTGSFVPEGADVRVDVVLEPVSEGILATGTAVVAWAGECRRCLRPVAGELRVGFCELFEEHPTEGESYPLRHDQVDFEPLAREAVLLELPQAPLCTEACRGLCPRCGADLNEGPCGCVPDDRDPRWAALDVLRTPTED